MTKSSSGKVERTRTFTGCRTCRSRHAKCDEARPDCGTCRRLGLDCGGYGARLFWITDGDAAMRPEQQLSHRGSQFRYPLFTEAHRRLMTIELADSLGRQSAMDLLADIDSACERSEGPETGPPSLVKGPFGVFDSRSPAPTPAPAQDELLLAAASPNSHSSSTSSHVISADSDLGACPDPDGLAEEIHRQHWPDQISEANFDLFVGSLDPSLGLHGHGSGSPGTLLMADPSMNNYFLESPPAVEGLSLFSPSFVSRAIESGAMSADATHEEASPARMDMAPRPASPRVFLQPHGNTLNLPEHAEPLLRYYKQHIDGATASMQAKRKSPWQLIFLPCALETFAELSLWNGTSHTRSTILYTLLAHSAFQLHATNKPGPFASHWRDVGERHQEKAQQHLRNALQMEMFGPKQAKYKELLMAILAMAMTSLFNGGHAFRIFLLDAERLIRLRGLVNANPYKIRLLHHMYTHLRVIAESVSIAPESITNGSTENTETALSVRTFRLAEDSLNIGLDPDREKGLELGYRDIHLEIQGQWKETLYPVIYGVPESLMTLLSQTISVANEKNRLESLARCNPKLSVDLAHHVKTLETSIWSWSMVTESIGPPRPPHLPALESEELMDHPHARSMALAIHQALVIYFYRRVYDLNAMILQDMVKKTLDFLEPCLEQMIDDQDFAASLAWPAFIAACEAATPELQEQSLKCLTATDERGLFFTPKPAKQIVSSIWERRKQTGDWTLSWPCVLVDC
ncbi:fungal-specific transcription factor domain-containing protein [Dactylonectria estremocensis]|uniref:Fungal-specific transcription factor domain-containing protein n=1 Tax=Dactylonectria estremocensis TaxID=1079267 RepID=A0A9P9DW93_9HYPO|nr:fungal-specific transcription factor domain-containing protein [Dactylonectria estremocensis]